MERTEAFQVTVKTLTGQQLIVQLPEYSEGVTSVLDLKRGVERINGSPPHFQRIIFTRSGNARPHRSNDLLLCLIHAIEEAGACMNGHAPRRRDLFDPVEFL